MTHTHGSLCFSVRSVGRSWLGTLLSVKKASSLEVRQGAGHVCVSDWVRDRRLWLVFSDSDWIHFTGVYSHDMSVRSHDMSVRSHDVFINFINPYCTLLRRISNSVPGRPTSRSIARAVQSKFVNHTRTHPAARGVFTYRTILSQIRRYIYLYSNVNRNNNKNIIH